MIELKNKSQIELMRQAGRIVGESLELAREAVREGVSTKRLDEIIRGHIEKSGAVPSFLGYNGFPASACVSINNEVIHGIPSDKRILAEGDIVKIDVGAIYRGYHADAAKTFPVGNVSELAARLIDAAHRSFDAGIAALNPGCRWGDAGNAIENCAAAAGFSVVRKFIGHGVGRSLHESPELPNFGKPGHGTRILSGMTLAIEPMLNAGGHDVKIENDKWTVVTSDGSLSSHYEHTVAVTDEGCVLLTEV